MEEYSEKSDASGEAVRVGERTVTDLYERIRQELEDEPEADLVRLRRRLYVWEKHILEFPVRMPTGETRILGKIRVRAQIWSWVT